MSLLNRAQRIIPVKDHFEAYDDQWGFLCRGDTFDDCAEIIVKMIREEANESCRLDCAF